MLDPKLHALLRVAIKLAIVRHDMAPFEMTQEPSAEERDAIAEDTIAALQGIGEEALQPAPECVPFMQSCPVESNVSGQVDSVSSGQAEPDPQLNLLGTL